ncbi:hypothetical protein RND81_11G041900 [Saponaria officinalis]|uniref:Retrovirus-related Pol polyprotein from transposon TNT 1-94-like beta-barrel domain-containing protein n=1 Tax=Saponaria officinalis TaxID=3572 RepID=A0AAW1HHV2_SAPOF
MSDILQSATTAKKPGHSVDKCYRLQNKNKRYANNVHGGDQAGILGAFDASQGRPHSDNPLTNSQTDVQNVNSTGNSNLYERLMNLLKNSQDHCTLAPGVANFAGNSTVSSDAFAYSSSWILDSGASDHMCSNKLLFSELHALPKAYSVSLPNGHIVTINSVGTVPLTPQITLCNVLFIPSFKFNLLSIGKLCKQLNSIILFTPDLCCLQGSSMKMSLVLGNNSRDLYLHQQSPASSRTAPVVPNVFSPVVCNNSVLLWHHRLGHLPLYKLQQMKLCTESDSNANKMITCSICAKARQHRLSFPLSQISSPFPFYIIHIDL